MEIRRSIFTSYFGNMRKVKEIGAIPIAICAKSPDWYDGLEYKKLAPSYNIFSEYKYGSHSEKRYTEDYNWQILARLNPIDVANELCDLADTVDSTGAPIVLLCYEKKGDFCHRNLDSEWFRDAGISCTEL